MSEHATSYPLNRPELSQAIQRLLNIKGAVIPTLDSRVSIVINAADLFDTPSLRYGIPVCRGLSCAAGAATNSYVGVQPGSTQALQITQVVIDNETAGAQAVKPVLLNATTLATFTAVTAPTALFDLSSPTVASLRSSAIRADRFNGTAFDNLGDLIVPAGTTMTLNFPAPGIILYGNDEGGLPFFGIANRTQNEVLKANFYGREWPLPGR